MNKRIMIVLLSLAAVMSYGEMRTWTAASGQTLEAEYVRDTMGQVWLKTASGQKKKVPIAALSKADQDYIYSQTLPKIEISLDDNIKRMTRDGDIDNVRQAFQCEFEIVKTSKRPYPGELTVYFFSVGWALEYKEYWVIETHTEKFKLSDKNNNKYTYKGESFELEFDPEPAWGNKFEGMLICVKTADGKILECKGRNLNKKHLKYLMGVDTGTRFDDDWEKRTSKRR